MLFFAHLPWVISTLASADGVVADGAQWKQVSTFRSSGDAITRLQVSTRGRVRVRGERGMNGVSATLTKRIKAPTALAAKARLEPVAVTLQNQGGLMMVDVRGPDLDSPELTLELTVPKQIKQTAIQTRWGDVDAADLDGAVFVESGGGSVRIDSIAQDVMARTVGGEIRLGRIGGSLNCATGGGTIRVDTVGGNAEFSTGGGEIWVREVRGWLRANTTGGNIHVERAGGDVSASSGGGVIEIARAGGTVTATTAGGSIEIAGGKNLQCESGEGTIRLKGVDGSLRAITANGMILADVRPGGLLSNSVLAASGGDIIVYLPSNLAVTVRARTEPRENSGDAMPGRIVSEFTEIQGRRERRRGLIAEGRLNGGGPLLDLSALGGSIHLRRLKP
ncbi:MAG: DUF4097 domain-containing protein [Bryobacteraceae bacterium]|nr:DUF4097 domain-containing protein [Bryobacteraceae bacterium]